MGIQVSTQAWHESDADWLVVGVPESPDLSGPFAALDASLGGTLSRLVESEDVSGKLAELVPVLDVPGIAAGRLLTVGLGTLSELDRAKLGKAMMTSVRKIASKKDQSVAIALPETLPDGLSAGDAAEIAARAIIVGPVGQDSLKNEQGHHPLAGATILAAPDSETDAKSGAEKGTIIGEAINLTRNLVDLPAEIIYPESFAELASEAAAAAGVTCTVLGQSELEAEKMGSLLAVAQGSDRPPRVVIVEYKGGGADAPTLAIVGKGVTFDSGGLSLKSSEGMLTMKCDMAGAATALGATIAIARLGLPVNVTGYMGLVENMVSGNSYKLGDILTARNGVTIEVQNTDAEGRLVLADVLSYAADNGADRIIDLATLTGACVVALGEEVTGVFSNDQDWANSVLSAAKAAGEDAWQLPMFDHYSKLLKSDVADCRNIGGRWGGAITAAKFLEKFVAEKPWAHLDIAGPSFASSNKGHREGGSTACMVRTLIEVAASLGE
jgi:leucyl aminopeptidase